MSATTTLAQKTATTMRTGKIHLRLDRAGPDGAGSQLRPEGACPSVLSFRANPCACAMVSSRNHRRHHAWKARLFGNKSISGAAAIQRCSRLDWAPMRTRSPVGPGPADAMLAPSAAAAVSGASLAVRLTSGQINNMSSRKKIFVVDRPEARHFSRLSLHNLQLVLCARHSLKRRTLDVLEDRTVEARGNRRHSRPSGQFKHSHPLHHRI